jgi:AraC family transcriptional regulator of adaptative response / DNA-3-methyladenine glycosylase II
MGTVAGLTRSILDRARRSRDARFDGRFFIAVRSTRIYCRPICPSRLSNDSNVRYYATAAEAAEAGYRPCLRCRPEAAPGSPAWSGTSAVVQRALRLIQEGALDDGSLGELSERLGIGVRHLNRLFAQHVGASPVAVAQTRRLHLAKRLLDDTQLPITEIALAAGFGSIRRFNDVFLATYGKSPRELRKARAGPNHRDDAEITLRLAYRPPYDWEHMCTYLAERALPGVEAVSAASYTRAIRTPSGRALIEIRPIAHAHALELRIWDAMPAELPCLLSTVRRMFDLTADPARIAAVLSGDALLRPLIARRPGLRIPGVWDPFEGCVRAIIGEPVNVAAGAAVLGRLSEQFGERIAPKRAEINRLFPSPAALADASPQALASMGVPAEALPELARRVRDKAICFDASAQEVARMLRGLPGMDRERAAYVGLRALGEPDAFSCGAQLLRRRAWPALEMLTRLDFEARAEEWRPFRGYALLHLAAGEPPPKHRASSCDVLKQPVARLHAE